MTDREKLVELINHVCEGHAENLMQPYGVETLADHLIANGVTVDAWISVEDRLPEINVDVNICDSKNNVSTGCLSSRTTRERRLLWSTRHRGSKTDITHWMPLPEPPKEEEHATD